MFRFRKKDNNIIIQILIQKDSSDSKFVTDVFGFYVDLLKEFSKEDEIEKVVVNGMPVKKDIESYRERVKSIELFFIVYKNQQTFSVWHKDGVTSADLSILIDQAQVIGLAEKVLKFINIKEVTWLRLSQVYSSINISSFIEKKRKKYSRFKIGSVLDFNWIKTYPIKMQDTVSPKLKELYLNLPVYQAKELIDGRVLIQMTKNMLSLKDKAHKKQILKIADEVNNYLIKSKK